jgi:hypothetical protein
MPRIFDARLVDPGQGRLGPDISDLGFSREFAQLEQFNREVKRQEREADFAIDTANFQMAAAEQFQKLQESGRHDTATGTDYFGDAPLDKRLPDYAMEEYSKLSSNIEAKYGVQGKEFVARHKVGYFGDVLNTYSTMRQASNIDYFRDASVAFSRQIEGGSISYGDAKESITNLLNISQMPTNIRERVSADADDMLTYSQFKSELSNNPIMAVQKNKIRAYSTASEGTQNKIAVETESYIKSMAMKEISAANDAASVAFRHSPNNMPAVLAKEAGMYEVEAEIKAAQGRAAAIDYAVSGNLVLSSATNAAIIKDAIARNDPQALALAVAKQNAIGNREKQVKDNPVTWLANEGIAANEGDLSDLDAFVADRRDVRVKAQELYGVKVGFMSDGKAQEFSQGVMSQPVDSRAQSVMSLVRNMTDGERADASFEMRDVNSNVAVVASIAPRGESVDASVWMDRQDLGTAILAGVDKDYAPKDSDLKLYMSQWEKDVNWGDPAVKEHVKQAALSAYTYYARRDGSEAWDMKKMDSVMDRVTGGRVEFGEKKVTNFMLDNGA